MCINKKVVGALVAVAVIVYLVAPQAIGAAATLLVLAICPVSMIVMMRAMSGGRGNTGSADAPRSEVAELRAEVERLRTERAGASFAPPAADS